MTKTCIRVAALFAVVCFAAAFIMAQRPFRLQTGIFTGLSSPVFFTNAGDGSRRVFVVEQGGTIKVARPGSRTLTNYLSVSVSCCGERGLLGLAFHPQFENNRRFFVYYTRTGDGAIEIAEYEQDAANPNVANPTRIRVIITIPHPTFGNHNGGTVAFGPDGYLYAAPGDGGSGNDPGNNAQNLNSLLGKMLRIDINTPVGQVPAYNIPPSNPFAGASAGADEIYAYGLRNPYRFSFDRGSGQLWVGDVGQGAREEVDIITSGGNYGWRVFEGTLCTINDPSLCPTLQKIDPIFEYTRVRDPSNTANRCSVTGGYVYRGKQSALPVGNYVYGDYCTGEILMWNGSQQSILRDTGNNALVSFGEDEDGEMYIVRQHNGNFTPNTGSIDKIAGVRTNADFDGDGGTDLAVFRRSDGFWYSLNPDTFAAQFVKWGITNNINEHLVPDDYDADGITDHAVFRSSEDGGTWYILNSSTFTLVAYRWGLGNDIASPGDFDGDGQADITVYRLEDGYWYTLRSSDGQYSFNQFGIFFDYPVNGDWDGDGRDDLAVYRPGAVWYVRNSGDGQVWGATFGSSGDQPVPADYDGDGRLDLAVFKRETGTWHIRRSSDGVVYSQQWGLPEDIVAPGDYDRDNRDDIAVWRPSQGVWYVSRSSDGAFYALQWGLGDDEPLPWVDQP